jgi:hypothetical protein
MWALTDRGKPVHLLLDDNVVSHEATCNGVSLDLPCRDISVKCDRSG